MYVLTGWTSRLGSHQQRYPLLNLREFISLGWESLHPALEVITWSLNVLATGVHPSTDFEGKPYRGKFAAGSPISGLQQHVVHAKHQQTSVW